jgi:hypothetical protein
MAFLPVGLAAFAAARSIATRAEDAALRAVAHASGGGGARRCSSA